MWEVDTLINKYRKDQIMKDAFKINLTQRLKGILLFFSSITNKTPNPKLCIFFETLVKHN